jgi:peptide chain release factor 1
MKRPEQGSFQIKPEELKIETFRSSGPGGQYMQKTESAVRITHLPTKISAVCQTARGQAQNKESALRLLRAKLWQKRENEDMNKIISKRRAQIKQARRSEKIRTYNFPQNRITDHRLRKKWHNLEKILEGDLEPIIRAFAKAKRDD